MTLFSNSGELRSFRFWSSYSLDKSFNEINVVSKFSCYGTRLVAKGLVWVKTIFSDQTWCFYVYAKQGSGLQSFYDELFFLVMILLSLVLLYDSINTPSLSFQIFFSFFLYFVLTYYLRSTKLCQAPLKFGMVTLCHLNFSKIKEQRLLIHFNQPPNSKFD